MQQQLFPTLLITGAEETDPGNLRPVIKYSVQEVAPIPSTYRMWWRHIYNEGNTETHQGALCIQESVFVLSVHLFCSLDSIYK